MAGGVLYVIASGQAGFDVSAGFASNGYGEHSPVVTACWPLVCEVVMTGFFLFVIMGPPTAVRRPGLLPSPSVCA